MMDLTIYIKLIVNKIEEAQAANNLAEVKRLLKLLVDTINEDIFPKIEDHLRKFKG